MYIVSDEYNDYNEVWWMGANKNRWDCPWMDILMLMSSLFVEAVGHLLNIFIYVRLCACICINYRSRMRFVGMVSASSVGVRTLLFGWRWWTGCIRVGSARCWLSTHRLAAAVIECIHRSSRSVSTAAAAAATNHPLLKLDAAAVWSAVSHSALVLHRMLYSAEVEKELRRSSK